jgi:hypothetical protein
LQLSDISNPEFQPGVKIMQMSHELYDSIITDWRMNETKQEVGPFHGINPFDFNGPLIRVTLKKADNFIKNVLEDIQASNVSLDDYNTACQSAHSIEDEFKSWFKTADEMSMMLNGGESPTPVAEDFGGLAQDSKMQTIFNAKADTVFEQQTMTLPADKAFR